MLRGLEVTAVFLASISSRTVFAESVRITGRLLVLICCVAMITGCGRPLHVIIRDESGAPINGATVTFTWTTGESWGPGSSGTPHEITVATDSNGEASASTTDDHYASVEVHHPSYYGNFVTVVDAALTQHASSETPLPITLERIISPQHLIGKKAWVVLPSLSGQAGYDFVAGDLVSPLGKGISTDCLLKWSEPPSNSQIEGRKRLDFLFSPPSPGVLAKPVSGGRSELLSERVAPSVGYVPSMRESEDSNNISINNPRDHGGIILYFCVSHEQKLIYGKILGEPDIRFYRDNPNPVLMFTYAINPSGNRSLEPDTNSITFPSVNGYEKPYQLPETND